jgi:hypothetical protein
MFDQLSAEIVPSLTNGRPNTNNNNNKAKCIPAGTLRVLAGKKQKDLLLKCFSNNFPKLPFLYKLHSKSSPILQTIRARSRPRAPIRFFPERSNLASN